jgi:DNA-binding XRE family transcriptional regulator
MTAIAAFDAETRRRVKRLVDARAREKMARPAVERTRLLDPPTEDREVLGFGDRIREVRLAAGLSQHGVARRARPFFCAAALNRTEAGSRPNPTLTTLWALAAALDLRVTITAKGIEMEWLGG